MCTFHDRLQQLADAIGVTKSTMAKYDRGDLEPNLTNVKKIADALNVSVDLLLGNDAFVKRMETADLAFLKSLRDTALKNNLINNVEYKTLSHSDVANKVFDIIDDDKTSDAVRLSLSVDIALAINPFIKVFNLNTLLTVSRTGGVQHGNGQAARSVVLYPRFVRL